MIDVLVSGAAGRMGREVCRAVTADPDMRVVAAVDPAHAGESLAEADGLVVSGDLEEAIATHAPAVMVDFTHPSAVERNLEVALAHGVHCVVGTTGLATDRLLALARDAREGTCLFVAPNFAIGAVLMMRFAAEAARYLPHAEIVELHHDRKVDAPSGTALRTAGLIAAARREPVKTPGAESEVVTGARGADIDDVHVHSVRLPGLVAHQEVLFGGLGQTLTIRHDSIDRTSFMPGVLLAIRKTIGHSGLIVGLEQYLED